MKIVRTKGDSFTTSIPHTQQHSNTHAPIPTSTRLGRGLKVAQTRQDADPSFKSTIPPDEVPDFLASDFSTLMRQTISVLDKIIRKPKGNNLGNFNPIAYVDRVRLADVLWKRLIVIYPNVRANGRTIASLLESWTAKAHPYAIADVRSDNPQSDENFLRITKAKSKLGSALFEGRWRPAFWREGPTGPAYEAIADAVFRHILDRQHKLFDRSASLSERPTPPTKPEYDSGFIERRGENIATSANDPRITSPHSRAKRLRDTLATTDEKSVAACHFYFEFDVVKTLYGTLAEELAKYSINSEVVRAVPPDIGRWFAKQCGQKLYVHFGQLRDRVGREAIDNNRLWAVHNSTREFYRELSKSTRFIRACAESAKQALRLCPATHEDLLRVLSAQRANADISGYIRLGKMVAHASDISSQVSPGSNPPSAAGSTSSLQPMASDLLNKLFAKRLDYFATSLGQAEIKRNEAIVRKWRTSVALSVRTLQTWIGRFFADNGKNSNYDPVSEGNPEKAYAHFFDRGNAEAFRSFAKLVFGARLVEFTAVEPAANAITSRYSIIAPDDERAAKENMWTFVQLARAVRNGANHFSLKDRFLPIIARGLLKPGKTGKSPPEKGEATPEALDALKRLLEFDIALLRRKLTEELQLLNVETFVVKREQVEGLACALSEVASDLEFTTPRFITLAMRAKNIGSDEQAIAELRPFASLNLDDVARSQEGPNHCAIGLLRMVYTRGFEAWLERNGTDTKLVKRAVEVVAGARKKRASEAAQERSLRYSYPETIADGLDDKAFLTLESLFGALAAKVMSEAEVRDAYRAKKADVKIRADRVEQFKLDIVGYLFGVYLREEKLMWLLDLPYEKFPASDGQQVIEDEADGNDEGDKWAECLDTLHSKLTDGLIGAWQAQIYAWLYLVPVDEITLLRHQMNKSESLEGKGEDRSLLEATSWNDVLAILARLMRLYSEVHDAGFDGQEHWKFLVQDKSLADLCYQDKSQFDVVYSNERDTHKQSLPGTRRGLRQLLFAGNLPALSKLFEKHPVTQGEVAEFERLKDKEVVTMFELKRKTHAEIVELVKAGGGFKTLLSAKCSEYRDLAVKCAKHDFAVKGARLGEHARLHLLMMRVLGRLTDFTLMWERDRLYFVLGFLYRKYGACEGAASRVHIEAVRRPELSDYDIALVIDGQKGILWDAEYGEVLTSSTQFDTLIGDEGLSLFIRYFGRSAAENPRDVQAERQRQEDATRKGNPAPAPYKPQFRKGKLQIRNDFAHYNVVSGRRTTVNMTYLVNSVRSLMSYDRKLKNAVSKSITDILYD